MRSRTALGMQLNRPRLALYAACLMLVAVGAGGCVLGNDNDRPVLAVDPVWDTSPGERFLPGSCAAAGVAWWTWDIKTRRGRSLAKSEDLEPCKPGLDFYDLAPGEYQLELRGYDRREQERWAGNCVKLELGRFDVLYHCEIEQVIGETTSDVDAGLGPDAGDGVDASVDAP